MQLMTWTMARLGSRFNLLLEPHKQRVRHSALGRFLDRPMDLMVGLVEPDGTLRTLPFTRHGQTLYGAEQFERFNSITYRAFSEKYRLRFEFNIHSVFYPQHEEVCLLPAVFLEMRVSPTPLVRWIKRTGPTPEHVKLVIQLDRPGTKITTSTDLGPHIDMSYRSPIKPRREAGDEFVDQEVPEAQSVQVFERIVSLNADARPDESGRGLEIDLPVTEVGSGTKWRLVWGAHCGDAVAHVGPPGTEPRPARFRYTRHWKDINEVMRDAVEKRDEYLALSRRLEKIVEQAPLNQTQRHLIDHSMQAYLSNTWWLDVEGQDKHSDGHFSVWEGSCFFHSTVDVEYNNVLFYLSLWPQLLAMQLDQWTSHVKEHAKSKGLVLSHDMGAGEKINGQAYDHDMPVEENSNFLLLMQAYTHWTGDTSEAAHHAEVIEKLARYLLWTDRDASGFPSEGIANTIDDALPAVQFSRKQTYLAVKRAAALRAAADMLMRVDRKPAAREFDEAADFALPRIESAAWLGDHYAVCVDKSAIGLTDAWTGEALPEVQLTGHDAYSIYTGNGLLLPMMVGQAPLLDRERMIEDCLNAARETQSPYGCGHTSAEPENVWVSQNLWRDHLIRYLGHNGPNLAPRYWDMQVVGNTVGQSLGYVDTYITNNLTFYPRGITSIGYLLAAPRLVIDRLSAGGSRITVEPTCDRPQRWPLLPLADWKAGKVPVCVVDADNKTVRIEGECDPVIVHGGDNSASTSLIG
ncbi:MAG: DUF4965 domain-containing protein [Phycisphaera sp.]|nr:DUF4965 domain-containing protein [Phycisphaera sp.]